MMKKMMMLILTLVIVLLTATAFALDNQAVETAARAYVPADAVLSKVEMDDGLYEATFRIGATNEKYEVKVDENGAVVQLESENKSVGGAKAKALTEEQVASAVEALYEGAVILRQDDEIDDGEHEIEVFFHANGVYGTLKLNAETGALVERDVYFGEYASDGILTIDAASAALKSLKPDAIILKIKMDEDDGHYEFEGDAEMGGSRYEFTLDGTTGELIEWERD